MQVKYRILNYNKLLVSFDLPCDKHGGQVLLMSACRRNVVGFHRR